MLTAGDALAKTLAKSQKVTFWSQKNGFECFFFLLTAVDALIAPLLEHIFSLLASKNGFYSRFWLTVGVALINPFFPSHFSPLNFPCYPN